jgi:endonuclease III-like uncharacterized protein
MTFFTLSLSCRKRVIEMTSYKTKIIERLKVLDDRKQADSDRLKKLIETKYNDQYVKLQWELGLCQTNGKMFRDTIIVVILLLVFYLSGYGGSGDIYLMLN